MGLLADFRAQAVARGRFPDDQRLTPPALFALVRDMPYARPSQPTTQAAIEEWRATCSGKHVLLQALFEEFGRPSLLLCALHEFTPDNSPWLPPSLSAHLDDGPLPDVHNFLRLQASGGRWMTVDATWPLAAAALGLPVNERFEEGRDMLVACDPDEVLHAPPDADAYEFERQLIERHVGAHIDRRERFLAALSEWLATATTPAPASAPPS